MNIAHYERSGNTSPLIFRSKGTLTNWWKVKVNPIKEQFTSFVVQPLEAHPNFRFWVFWNLRLCNIYWIILVSAGILVVNDTQSDSIQYLNFAKNDSFNIRFNIALPKIQFKIFSIQNKLWWFNSKYYSIQ